VRARVAHHGLRSGPHRRRPAGAYTRVAIAPENAPQAPRVWLTGCAGCGVLDQRLIAVRAKAGRLIGTRRPKDP